MHTQEGQQKLDRALIAPQDWKSFDVSPLKAGLDQSGSNKRPLFDAHAAGFDSRAECRLISIVRFGVV